MSDDEQILNSIQEIRAKNNIRHVDMWRLAFRCAPEEARAIAKDTIAFDRQIDDLSEQLANNGH